MRSLFCLLVLFFAAQESAPAEPLPQDNYQRIIFTEDFSGYYLLGFYFKKLDKVRFDACEGGTHAECKPIAELSHTKLKSLEAPMLEMLRKYRAEVNEKKNSFWHFFSRAGMKSRDTEAIDEIIAEIEKHGLGSLVVLTEENLGRDSPKITTPEFARELAARMKKVLESGPPMNDVDCIPYFRRQGL